jgi:ectoine hydroxylase-related dioxygenase (phytanoyl-CoA dioxygenase family)
VATNRLVQFAAAYDSAVASAAATDISIGSSTTRVNDFVNRGPEFDELYVFKPIIEACKHIIAQPFKLSTMHARTLRPYSPAQNLHVDFQRDAQGWPMLGFIIMVDEFRHDNGATRFVPGSHKWPTMPDDFPPAMDYDGQLWACGPAGSVIIYNGSIWHGHSANLTGEPRRSIQGAYIRRDAAAAVDQAARIRPETLSRIGQLAKHVLAL